MSLGKLRNLFFFQKLFSYNGMKSQMAFMDIKGVRDIYHVKQKRFIDKAMGYMDIKPGKDMLAKFAVFGEAAGK